MGDTWPNSNIPKMRLDPTPSERDTPGAAQSDDGQGGYRALKADLVADDVRAKNDARRAAEAKVQATLEDKLGPTLAEVRSQDRVLEVERVELQRKAGQGRRGPGRLASVFRAHYAGKE